MKLRVFSVILVAGVALAACGGSSKKANDAANGGLAGFGATSTTAPPGAPSGNTPTGPAIGKIRVANFVLVNGQPGPAMDIYDTHKPASTDAALIKGLKYGAVSDYVTPHAYLQGDTTTNLYAFPAGSLTPTEMLNGSNIDNSGFEAGDQMTIALVAPSTGSGLGSTQIVEAGSRMGQSSKASAPAGKGLLMAREAANSSDTAPEQYLVVDGKCPSPDGNPSTIPVTLGDALFTLAPGTYTLGVTTSPRGRGLTTCAGQKQSGTTQLTIAADQRVDVFVYGDPQTPSIATAPVS